MEILMLGTGSAWCVPEHSCNCAICTMMTDLREERTRTSFLVKSMESILVDCGPDLRAQMIAHGVKRPDFILITHEHGDHFLGLDDLLAFRRSVPEHSWIPIPVYATEQTWKAIEIRFGYLLNSLIEKRLAFPGLPLERTTSRITPFKTFHGESAKGSVGYVLETQEADGWIKIVYTSDFMTIEDEPGILRDPDVLIIQSHWLNEPHENRPSHMSFQNAIEYIRRWKPRKATYLVHISDGDQVPGDSCNNFLKKLTPLSPLSEPNSSIPYPVPRCASEWQDVVARICRDYGIPGPVVVTRDGMKITLD